MSKTLLAVDDSLTMRKVIEMTFAGEDIKVRSVATAQDALAACRKERPDIVLADVALDGHSGYDLCRAIKDEFRGIPVIVLASKQNPYDPARGQASGADEHLDKPYDTAKAIEAVKKILAQGQSVAPAPIAASVSAPGAGAPAARAPMFNAAPSPQPAAAAAKPPAIAVAMPAPQQPHSTVQGMPAQGRAAATADPKPALARNPTPALRPQQTVKMTSDAPPSPARLESAHGNGGAQLSTELQAKLQGLGLTSQQVDAVLALSREVVERVVWEVVPVLAETMVKEEIARLTRER